MTRAIIAALLAATTAAAAADPGGPVDASVRLSAGAGVLDELTWSAPGLDLAARARLDGLRLGVAVGYAPIDNHTFLSDARVLRIAAAAGFGSGDLAIDAVASVEQVAFHADPDVLAGLPDTDLLRRRSDALPALGIEASLKASARVSVGAFARVALARLELTGDGDGGARRARLALFGLFAEYRMLRR